jgi:hypothetical protein
MYSNACLCTAAHNKLSGTIPFSLQSSDFIELDLSYNKLTGEYNHEDHYHDEDEEEISSKTTMNLQVNRLSGPLSETAYSVLRILDGNLFGCEYIPNEDENSDTYACGEYCSDCVVLGTVLFYFAS